MLTLFDKIKLFPIWLLTLLPLNVLFVITWPLYALNYYIVGYRKKVVVENLAKSFPERSLSEIKQLTRKFYKYITRYFIESIYLLNMSKKEINKRYKFTNLELIDDLYAKGKNLILATSHFGNWEWAANLWNLIPYNFYGIYRPLSNKTFDRLYIHLRGKYGSIPIPLKQTLRQIVGLKRSDSRFALYQVGDQRPGWEDLSYWTTFLNQETPVITGTEKLARKFDLAVVFLDVTQVRNGYYEVTFKIISENPKQAKENEITEKYIRSVEKMIIRQPEFYLWSHKRWKFKKEDYIKEEVKSE